MLSAKGNDGKGFRRRMQPSRWNVALSVIVLVSFVVLVHHFQSANALGQGQLRSSSSATTSIEKAVSPTLENARQCRFFLAESAVPRAGMGVFTAVPIRKGEPAQPWPDICVYLTQVQSSRHEVNTHTWQDFRFAAQWESTKGKSRAACEGFVTNFNSMSDERYASARPNALQGYIHDNGGLRREKDPGAGAITHYYGASSVTLRDLGPGAELMLWDNSHDVHSKHKVEPRREPEWLHTHGMCGDNLKVQRSINPAMGRGAFATRSMRAGTMVAPAPVQIFSKGQYDFAVESKQLILNYCFQIEGTEILIFPYGPGVGLINHSSEKANVKVRWSQSNLNHPQWLDLPLDEFLRMQYPGSMILEYVATRDIQDGEEIYVDYGASWENAWNEHVRNWKPVAKGYIYSTDMNPKEPFRTIEEQKENPYPKNLITVFDTGNYGHSKEKMPWKPSKQWPESLVECQVLSRTKREDGYFYRVSGSVEVYYDDQEFTEFIEYDVPHKAIQFVDKPGASDQHLPNAFRYPMEFPANLTPSQWRPDFVEDNTT